MKKNGFLTFIFAWVPGCGQMYQGYMRRGVSLLFWFFLALGLGIWTPGWSRIPLAWLMLPVIWAYAFFDTFNLRMLSPEQRAAMADTFLPNPAWVRRMLGEKEGKSARGRAALVGGILLILLGGAGLYSMMWDSFGWVVYNLSATLYDLARQLPYLLVALALVALGVWLLVRRARAMKDGPGRDEAGRDEAGGDAAGKDGADDAE